MISIDPRTGSGSGKNPLLSHLPDALCVRSNVQLPADAEFIANGPDDLPIVAGVEVKEIHECLTSMTDGRLADQVRRMLQSGYARVYLLIYGQWRRSDEGILEVKEWDNKRRQFIWNPARGRKGEGWTTQEFRGRIESLREFGDVRDETRLYDIKEAAACVTELYHYWQKQYGEHKSFTGWNQSGKGNDKPMNLLLPTSELPLVQRWARELPGIGQDKSKYVAMHFKSAAALAKADEKEWGKLRFTEHTRKPTAKQTTRQRKLSAEKIDEIMGVIRTPFGGNGK